MTNVPSSLARLRRQAGAPETEPHPGPGADNQRQAENIGRQLQRLAGARLASTARPAPVASQTLPDLVGGRWLENGLIAVETMFPLGTAHGAIHIDETIADALQAFKRAPDRHTSAVFMDTETTGLSGGSGTLAFLVGLARVTQSGLEICQLLLTNFAAEKSLLQYAARWIDRAGTLITYNGKSFDHPLLTARYRLAKLQNPFTVLAHLDLLHVTRRAYRHQWPNCRLRTAEVRLIGFNRIGDMPGAEIPDAWFKWIRNGRTDELPRVLQHNRWDLLSLAALLPALRASYEDPLTTGADVLSVARYHIRRGRYQKAYDYLRNNRDRLGHRAALELARLSGKNGDWTLAAAIWQQLAGERNIEALERLAKYREHISRDLEAALKVTRQLAALDSSNQQHNKRERRLRRMLDKASRPCQR